LGGVELQDCTVDSSSETRLLQGSVCDNDEILVDGEPGTIMSVTVDWSWLDKELALSFLR
jgi:hypothetical protein